jgi:hypothetical protein
MSEDHSEEGGAGGGSPEPDCTPLKKRRLATYTEVLQPANQVRVQSRKFFGLIINCNSLQR